jgi:hypothetical protein
MAVLAPEIGATCKVARILSSIYPSGSYSYFQTPGLIPTETSSSLSEDASGFFWALGAGDRHDGAGCDNGTFSASGASGWLKRPAGYPAYIHTTWAADPGIDSCIDESASFEKCVAVLLSDESSGSGYFALLTQSQNIGNYSLAQLSNSTVDLAPIPSPVITGIPVATTSGIVVSMTVPMPRDGVVATPPCESTAVGYRIYVSTVERNTAPPTIRALGDGDWIPVETEVPSIFSFDTTHTVEINCADGTDAYLAAALEFDSGYSTPHVSANSIKVSCDRQVAE